MAIWLLFHVCSMLDSYSLTITMLNMYICTTHLPYFYPIILHDSSIGMYLQAAVRVENSEDPGQLAFKKPADLDLHCFQNGIYLDLAW